MDSPRPNRRNQTTSTIRSSIINLHKSNVAIGDIARQLAIDRTTVYRWIRRYRERENVNVMKRTGRPRCTTAAEDNEIVEAARSTPLTTAVAIKRQYALPLNAQTVRNRLHEAGIYHHIPAKKPFITRTHETGRLCFALQFYPIADDFWKKVIFCDEKTFSSDEHGSLHCWRPANTR